MQAWVLEAEETGQIWLPNGWSPSVGRVDGKVAAYRAVNYMIQGWAAVVFKMAAVQLAEKGLWRYVRMVVHDEFALSVPRYDLRQLTDDVCDAATVWTKNMVYTTSADIYSQWWGIEDE